MRTGRQCNLVSIGQSFKGAFCRGNRDVEMIGRFRSCRRSGGAGKGCVNKVTNIGIGNPVFGISKGHFRCFPFRGPAKTDGSSCMAVEAALHKAAQKSGTGSYWFKIGLNALLTHIKHKK